MNAVARGMKAKTIRKLLRKTVNDWLDSIDDQTVRTMAADNAIVTGGSIASMLMGEPVNDYDIYFRNIAATKAVAAYYVGRFSPKSKAGIAVRIFVDDEGGRVRIVVKSAGIASEAGATKPYEYFEGRADGEAGAYIGEVMQDPGEIQDTLEETQAALMKEDGGAKFRPVFLSTNAITLSHRVQIVLRFYGEPDEIHKNYDFVHCTNHWCSWNDELTLRPAALEALLARELRYVGSLYPVCSIIRLRKFIRRGWTVNAGQILKMIMQAAALDLTDHAVLQDQLTGVDAAYFVELVNKLKDNSPEKVNTAYLVEIIDRMF
jgi:hypothetical protein